MNASCGSRPECTDKTSSPFGFRGRLAWLPLVALITLLPAEESRAADAPRLLLLPIVVHSAEDPDYLRSGLSDMLASRFERIGALDLVRAEAGERGTTDPDRALAIARERGAEFVLYGSFTRFGQGASLDVQCVPVPSVEGGDEQEPLREIFVHSGSIGEIIPDLDELAGKVSRFARGEAVVASGPPDAADPAVPVLGEDLRGLLDRVEALEATVELLIEQVDGATATDAE